MIANTIARTRAELEEEASAMGYLRVPALAALAPPTYTHLDPTYATAANPCEAAAASV